MVNQISNIHPNNNFDEEIISPYIMDNIENNIENDADNEVHEDYSDNVFNSDYIDNIYYDDEDQHIHPNSVNEEESDNETEDEIPICINLNVATPTISTEVTPTVESGEIVNVEEPSTSGSAKTSLKSKFFRTEHPHFKQVAEGLLTTMRSDINGTEVNVATVSKLNAATVSEQTNKTETGEHKPKGKGKHASLLQMNEFKFAAQLTVALNELCNFSRYDTDDENVEGKRVSKKKEE